MRRGCKGLALRRGRLVVPAVSEVRRRRVDPAGYCFSDQLSDVGKLDHLPHTILKSAMIPQAYIIVEDDAIDQDEIEFVSEVGTCKSMCFQSKFWVSSDDESEEDFPTPSNASLLRRAENAGFQADILFKRLCCCKIVTSRHKLLPQVRRPPSRIRLCMCAN